jgi:acyl-CoA synthetase (AMP-forming)/AMP-acid ligase II
MIKSDGANVSPLEVERALTGCPGVKMAFVVGVPDAERGEVVAAAVVPYESSPLDIRDLNARVSRELASYKVPSRWLLLSEEEVPWLGSGKPDKMTLQGRFLARWELEGEQIRA